MTMLEFAGNSSTLFRRHHGHAEQIGIAFRSCGTEVKAKINSCIWPVQFVNLVAPTATENDASGVIKIVFGRMFEPGVSHIDGGCFTRSILVVCNERIREIAILERASSDCCMHLRQRKLCQAQKGIVYCQRWLMAAFKNGVLEKTCAQGKPLTIDINGQPTEVHLFKDKCIACNDNCWNISNPLLDPVWRRVGDFVSSQVIDRLPDRLQSVRLRFVMIAKAPENTSQGKSHSFCMDQFFKFGFDPKIFFGNFIIVLPLRLYSALKLLNNVQEPRFGGGWVLGKTSINASITGLVNRFGLLFARS